MNITPTDFQAGETVPDNLSWKDLHRYVEKIEGEGFSATPYRVDLNMRIASPFATFILALLGILVALRPGIHGGIGAGVGISLGVAFAFIAVSNVGISLASAGALPPFLGVWAGKHNFCCARMLFLDQNSGEPLIPISKTAFRNQLFEWVTCADYAPPLAAPARMVVPGGGVKTLCASSWSSR